MPKSTYDFPDEIECEVLDKDGNEIGAKKFYNVPNENLLTNWILRPKPNGEPCVPLTNAVTPPQGSRKDQRGTKWSDGAVGWLCTSPDLQNQEYVFLLSSGASRGHGIFVNKENLWQCAVLFTVEHLISDNWQNHNDQFLIPNEKFFGRYHSEETGRNCHSEGASATEESRCFADAQHDMYETLPSETKDFCSDCLVWMLFNGKNLTASADDLEWNGQKWSVVNHFIPFTEAEVGANDRFESDFMVQYMEKRGMRREKLGNGIEELGNRSEEVGNRKARHSKEAGKGCHSEETGESRHSERSEESLSPEAAKVLSEGRKIWQKYFETGFNHEIRDKYKLNRADVGWYQVRFALKAYNELGENIPVSFDSFENAYNELTEKLRPQVYEYGFLKA